MKVSVVVCTHSIDRYDDFSEAVDSVLDQTYPDVEVVVVVDGSQEVYEEVEDDYGDFDDFVIHLNHENVGLLESRNTGAQEASGDVVAFIDDDAVADERWIEELVSVYEEHDVEAAGGKMTPLWEADEPIHLPEEFYWLVGVTYAGFPDEGEVRNTFGSNLSFSRDVFLELGGFDTDIGGRKGRGNLQGGETELCARLRSELDGVLYYNPDAEVAHRVYDYRTGFVWLLKRAFWQGYSKRAMETLVPDEGIDEEGSYLRYLLLDATLRRLQETFLGLSAKSFVRLLMIYVFTACVGLGYLYGFRRWR